MEDDHEQACSACRTRWGTISQLCGFLAWLCPLGIATIGLALHSAYYPQATHSSQSFLAAARATTPNILWSCVVLCLESTIPVFLLLAIAGGHIARSRSCGSEMGVREKARAAAGLRLGYLLLGIICSYVVILYWPSFDKRYAMFLAACRGNLKCIKSIMHTYSCNERNHYYPELSSAEGRLTARIEDTIDNMYPTYARCLSCPSGNRDKAFSYFYLGYAVHNDTEMEAFAAAYKKRLSEGLAFNSDLSVPKGAGEGTRTIYRLRASKDGSPVYERESHSSLKAGLKVAHKGDIAEAWSQIPILIERLGHHKPEGGNVLFLDGRVEYLRYPGPWPMTEKTISLLQEMEAYRPRQ